jgi:RNA polymerase sigma-70 factor, ECF subfamily
MIVMTDPTTGKEPMKPPANESEETVAEAPVAPAPVEEQVLVKRARRGDLVAYDELVQRYQQRIYATIYHMTANHEDANDLAQEAFIKGFQALKSFKGGSSFYTWVYRIAVNKTINFLKQRKNRSQMSLNDLDFNAEHDPDFVALISERTPRREANLAELQEKLNEAMLRLSEPHRLVVTLHDVQGLSHEEIAKIMDCNIGTVRSRLFYARQQLQGYLSDYLK